MEDVSCKLKDAMGDMNSFVHGLRRDTLDSYAIIRHNVGQSLIKVSKALIDMLSLEVMTSQQVLYDAPCIATGSFQKSFVAAAEVIGRSLGLIVGHSKQGESARPGSSSAHSLNWKPRQSRARDFPIAGCSYKRYTLELSTYLFWCDASL